ncbi:MAG: hypothetical protein WDM76_16075 [Limisphaerales bacterium]
MLIKENAIFFRLTPVQACRVIYGANPFPEAVEISRYLASHCAPDARILVLGSEPEIYFYSHRRSATSYICTFPLVERQPYAAAMQKDMIREIEQANPEYVVYVHIRTSWLQSDDNADKRITDWFETYARKHLQPVGQVEILSDKQVEYRWFSPQETVVPTRSDCWLDIFKRRANDKIPTESNKQESAQL